MPDQPLRPFSPPTELLSYMKNLPDWLSVGAVVTWVLYAIFAFWAIYTVIAIYHWLKYSHASWVAFPAIFVHLAVSLALMSYILSGNALFLSAYLP